MYSARKMVGCGVSTHRFGAPNRSRAPHYSVRLHFDNEFSANLKHYLLRSYSSRLSEGLNRADNLFLNPDSYKVPGPMSLLLTFLVYPLVLLILIIFLFHALAELIQGMTGSPRDQPSLANLFTFFGRLLASWLALMVCASYGVVASIALRLTGYGGLSQWTVGKAFEWVMGWAVGVEFVIIDEAGALKERPAIFVGNHQTEMDVLMLGCLFPPYTSVTAKKSLQYLPFLGWFMVLSKTVFIDRANSANARAAFDGAVKHMKSERQNVYIFPEGTRSYASKPELLPFKKGAFHLAVQAQVPIVPCVVANYSHILSLKKKLFLRGKVPVKVLPPIHTKGMTAADVPDLAQRVRDMMLDTMIELERQRTEGSIRIEPSSLGTSTAVEERKAEKKKAR